MKIQTRLFSIVWSGLLWLVICLSSSPLSAMTTAFLYQGRLNQGGQPVDGDFDLTFSLFTAPSAGSQVGSTLTNSATPIASGFFSVSLDYGTGIFTGKDLWLEIAVRSSGTATAYTVLNPRQPIMPIPYALYALTPAGPPGPPGPQGLSGVVPTFGKINVVVYTNNGVFTPPPGVTNIIVTLRGGGGGAGSLPNIAGDFGWAPNPCMPSFGGGGGGGTRQFLVSPGTTYDVIIGLGGKGADLGVNNATAGGDTSFGQLAKATGGAPGGSGSWRTVRVGTQVPIWPECDPNPSGVSGTFAAPGASTAPFVMPDVVFPTPLPPAAQGGSIPIRSGDFAPITGLWRGAYYGGAGGDGFQGRVTIYY